MEYRFETKHINREPNSMVALSDNYLAFCGRHFVYLGKIDVETGLLFTKPVYTSKTSIFTCLYKHKRYLFVGTTNGVLHIIDHSRWMSELIEYNSIELLAVESKSRITKIVVTDDFCFLESTNKVTILYFDAPPIVMNKKKIKTLVKNAYSRLSNLVAFDAYPMEEHIKGRHEYKFAFLLMADQDEIYLHVVERLGDMEPEQHFIARIEHKTCTSISLVKFLLPTRFVVTDNEGMLTIYNIVNVYHIYLVDFVDENVNVRIVRKFRGSICEEVFKVRGLDIDYVGNNDQFRLFVYGTNCRFGCLQVTLNSDSGTILYNNFIKYLSHYNSDMGITNAVKINSDLEFATLGYDGNIYRWARLQKEKQRSKYKPFLLADSCCEPVTDLVYNSSLNLIVTCNNKSGNVRFYFMYKYVNQWYEVNRFALKDTPVHRFSFHNHTFYFRNSTIVYENTANKLVILKMKDPLEQMLTTYSYVNHGKRVDGRCALPALSMPFREYTEKERAEMKKGPGFYDAIQLNQEWQSLEGVLPRYHSLGMWDCTGFALDMSENKLVFALWAKHTSDLQEKHSLSLCLVFQEELLCRVEKVDIGCTDKNDRLVVLQFSQYLLNKKCLLLMAVSARGFYSLVKVICFKNGIKCQVLARQQQLSHIYDKNAVVRMMTWSMFISEDVLAICMIYARTNMVLYTYIVDRDEFKPVYVINLADPKHTYTSVCFANKNHLVIGKTDGRMQMFKFVFKHNCFNIVGTRNLSVGYLNSCHTHSIAAVDEKTLAVGCSDNTMRVLQLPLVKDF